MNIHGNASLIHHSKWTVLRNQNEKAGQDKESNESSSHQGVCYTPSNSEAEKKQMEFLEQIKGYGASHIANQKFKEWESSLEESSTDFLEELVERVQNPSFSWEENLPLLEEDVDVWVVDQQERLAKSLEGFPPGLQRVMLRRSEDILQSHRDSMWEDILQLKPSDEGTSPPTSGDENSDPSSGEKPTDPSTHPDYQTPTFSSIESLTKNFNLGGGNHITLRLESTSSARSEEIAFYVSNGEDKKAVTISFSNEKIESSFHEFLEKSKMRGETVSYEKFKRFIDRIEKQFQNISEKDLERLQQKMKQKEGLNSKENPLFQLASNLSQTIKMMKF